MGVKSIIIAVVKKIRCKCRCIGGIEIEIKGSDSPPPLEIENTNNNTLSIENNVSNNVNLASVTPTSSPVMRRSPAPLPRQIPTHTYAEVF